MVSSTPRSHFIPPVPILQEAGWAAGPVWTGGKCHPHRDSIPDGPARSQSLYRLSYRAHPDAVDTVICAAYDGWRNYPKYVEQFTDELCIVAPCWTFIEIKLEDLEIDGK